MMENTLELSDLVVVVARIVYPPTPQVRGVYKPKKID